MMADGVEPSAIINNSFPNMYIYIYYIVSGKHIDKLGYHLLYIIGWG